MRTLVPIVWWTDAPISLGTMPRDTFSHMIDTRLVLVDATPKFSKAVVQITTPTANEYESPLHAL